MFSSSTRSSPAEPGTKDRPADSSLPRTVVNSQTVRKATHALLLGVATTEAETWVRNLHRAGPRGGLPLILVRCRELPASVSANQLFGHPAGAASGYTGAVSGAVACAFGGTLALIDVDRLPPDVQRQLSSVLNEQGSAVAGGDAPKPADVHCIATTSQDSGSLANQVHESLRTQLEPCTPPIPWTMGVS